MKKCLYDIFIFFTHDIWVLHTSNVDDFSGKVKSWLKTRCLAGRIFIQKDMWARDVAALTFASLMALIPFMAMMFVIARGFGYASILESWLNNIFDSQPIVAETIVGFVKNYISNTSSNYIIGTGIIVMLYTLISLMQKIERTFDDIWHTKERTWLRILAEYPTLFFCCGLMIIFASSFNLLALELVENLRDYIGIDGAIIPTFVLHLAAFIPMFLFFVFCYCVIPNTYVRFRSTLIPALLAGVCMSFLQYGYIYIQVYLSSYNVIYGSLAALPLFLLWLQMSWAITVFGALLSYTNQNLHHYDGDILYDNLSLNKKIKVCAIIMHSVCKRFRDGDMAFTEKELHDLTFIPQQIINGAVNDLLNANLLVEIKSSKSGLREEKSRLHPIEKIANLTFGTMIERLYNAGDDLLFVNNFKGERWDEIDKLIEKYIKEGQMIELSELD